MQGRLREQVATLEARMRNREVLVQSEEFQRIMAALAAAAAEMGPAEEKLRARTPEAALPHEQKALQFLQRAEAVFRDVRVSFSPNGGAGGGEAQRLSDDLADLFELELDKLRNQYETVQRGERQQLEREVDEALERLRELARRQQQENERARRRGVPGGGGGSGSQPELLEETEELARRLERLSREQSRPELMRSAERLQDPARQMQRQMQRSGQRGGESRSGDPSGSGIAALDELREARRLLDRSRGEQFGKDLAEMEERARRLSEMQRRIAQEAGALPSPQEAAGGGAPAQQRREGLGRLFERKDELAQEVAGLQEDLSRLAREGREQGEAARALRDAANSIRDRQIEEKIRFSKGVVRSRDPEVAQSFEQEIQGDLDQLGEDISGARASGGGPSPEQQAEDTLERTRELVSNLESLEQRLREKTSGGSSAARGEQSEQPGLPGEHGEHGEPGEQPSPGEQLGQHGQQGQQRQQGEVAGQGEGQSAGERSGEGGSGERAEGRPARRLGERPGTQAQTAEGRGEGTTDRLEQGGGETRGSRAQIGSSTGARFFQPGTMTAEDLRQFDRELGQRQQEARALRDQLREQGLGTADLDSLLRQLDRFDVRRINNDPLALDQLRAQVVEGLRQFEYRLWRELADDDEARLHLTGSDEVPESYRELVERYFKSLSETRP